MELSDLDCARELMELIPPMMRFIRAEMREAGRAKLTVPQFRILNRLYQSPASNRELADWMGIAPPTMTRMIDGLVKKGYVNRASGKDRREIQLEPTTLGKKEAQKIRELVQNKLSTKFSHLNGVQRKSMHSGLDVLRGIFLASPEKK